MKNMYGFSPLFLLVRKCYGMEFPDHAWNYLFQGLPGLGPNDHHVLAPEDRFPPSSWNWESSKSFTGYIPSGYQVIHSHDNFRDGSNSPACQGGGDECCDPPKSWSPSPAHRRPLENYDRVEDASNSAGDDRHIWLVDSQPSPQATSSLDYLCPYHRKDAHFENSMAAESVKSEPEHEELFQEFSNSEIENPVNYWLGFETEEAMTEQFEEDTKYAIERSMDQEMYYSTLAAMEKSMNFENLPISPPPRTSKLGFGLLRRLGGSKECSRIPKGDLPVKIKRSEWDAAAMGCKKTQMKILSKIKKIENYLKSQNQKDQEKIHEVEDTTKLDNPQVFNSTPSKVKKMFSEIFSHQRNGKANSKDPEVCKADSTKISNFTQECLPETIWETGENSILNEAHHKKNDQLRKEPQILDNSWLLGGLPNFLKEYISEVVDVRPDGNCGYRCISVATGGPEHKWGSVRSKLALELESKNNWYLNNNSFSDLDASLARIMSISSPCPDSHWMVISEEGELIANAFNRPVFVYSPLQSISFLPSFTPPNDNPPIILGITATYNHYFVIRMVKNPFPAQPMIDDQWEKNCLPDALGWKKKYSKHFSLFSSR